MADDNTGKPGLTTFGWLALLGAGAAYLSNKDRRGKVLDAVKGFTGKLSPDTGTAAGTDTTTKA